MAGPATGEAVDPEDLRRVRAAVPNRRLFVGSGVTALSARELLTVADGLIVGTAIKVNRDPSEPVDADAARALGHALGRG